jgi:hypothetical protein
MYHIENLLMVQFDEEKNMLLLYDIKSDGSKNLYTQVTLEQLINSGKDIACQEVGKIILARLKSTRETLFV